MFSKSGWWADQGFSTAPVVSSLTGWVSLIPQSGLVNAWPFDTTYTTTSVATDPVGGKNATLTSVTLNGSGPSTNLNNAGVFTAGSPSRGDTTLASLPSPNFSFVMWLNASNIFVQPRIFVNDHTDATQNGFQLLMINSNTVDLMLGNGTTHVTATATPISGATWTMITYTYDGTTLTPYLNSTAGTTQTLAGPVTAATNNVTFGIASYNSDAYTGMIAGVAIYNRVLTSGEVTTIAGL